MSPLKIVYMGTPSFAVPTLQALIEEGHEIVGVFCQPDKQSGRGKKIQRPPVKEVALSHNLSVYQPVTLRDSKTEELLKSLAPDLIVVVAYGKILPPWLIALPKYGCINVHASILPSYRGPAPIHWAILNGDTETGVTIMKMDNGLDTGDILYIQRVMIDEKETAGELFHKLSILGGTCINKVIDGYVGGNIIPTPQDHDKATFTNKITKDMGRISWKDSARNIVNRIRALNPAPGCYSFINGKRLKIWEATISDMPTTMEKPGTILAVTKRSFVVLTGEGSLEITMVQPENKKAVNAGDYCRGYQISKGLQFEE